MKIREDILDALPSPQTVVGLRRLQDIRNEAEQASHQLLAALPEAIYTTDAAGRITFYNEAAAALWGWRPTLGKDEFCGSWKLFWPDGTPLPHNECPMAMALKVRQPIRGLEAITERPDGTRVQFMAYPTPLFDADGVLTGAVNMLVDVTERRRNEEAARTLASVVAFSDDAILTKNLDGIITSWNAGAERLFGYTAEEVIGKPVAVLIPADRPDEEPAILARLRRGERIDHYETVRQRKDGSLLDISLCVSPIKAADGRITGASKIARDITERRRAQDQQRLLLREMDHRIKNLFMLAGSIVTLSSRGAETPKDLAETVRARLGALARAHALTLSHSSDLAARTEQPATLHRLIDAIVAPFDGSTDEGRQVVVTGPDSPVCGDAITSLALLLHELATNAAKYGALSTPDGHIDINCAQDSDQLHLTWAERDGPCVGCPPDEEGFGGILMRTAAKGQLDGTIRREWGEAGLTVHLSMSRARVTG